MMRLYRFFSLIPIIILLIGLTVCNARLYRRPPPLGQTAPEIEAQLRFLRQALAEGAGTDMQTLFPEGYFFSYILYGLSWVNVGLNADPDSTERAQALAEARWAKQHLDSPAGTAVFSPSLAPPYGMFYAGWCNYLLTGILLLQEPKQRHAGELQEFETQSAIIADAIERSPTPFLASYPGQAWPVDTFPAIMSLHGFGRLIDGRYESLIDNWLADVHNQLDTETGLVPHRTHFQTAQSLDGSRATSQTLILLFLGEINPELGRSYYKIFRQQHLVTRFGLPGVLEFPPHRSGTGDVDSGPLLGGVSLSATAVFLGTSRLYRDEEVATAVWQGGEALGLAINTGKQRRYAFGLLPIGDAFVIWAKTMTPWFEKMESTAYATAVPWWWRWPLHTLSLIVIFILVKLRSIPFMTIHRYKGAKQYD